MIDIHSHILPGVDDGVRTMEEALLLVRVESAGGTRAFCATSHIMEHRDVESLPMRAELIVKLRDELDRAAIDVQVVPGAEVYPFAGALEAMDAGASLSLAGTGKYVLVDLPLTQFPNDLDSFLFEIQARGLTPILAHPERTAPVQHDPELLRPLLERGIAVQVNAGSVLGQYGPLAVKSAHLILERRWAQFLASDSHRPSQTPKLKRAVSALSETLDAAYLTLMTELSGQAVLEGRPLPKRPPEPVATKKRWQWPFGR